MYFFIPGVSPPSSRRKKPSKSRDRPYLLPEDLGSPSSADGLGDDLTQTALPVFISEPEDAFALKSAPAVLRCSVAHAISVHFRDTRMSIFKLFVHKFTQCKCFMVQCQQQMHIYLWRRGANWRLGTFLGILKLL